MARGKKGYRARSFSGYRRTRIAPRGRMSSRTPWMLYLLLAIGLAIILGLVFKYYG